MPLVSVIIPNYNHGSFLPKRIETVIDQTFKDIEILILDDCSSDNSREIIERYAAIDNRIKYFYNEVNSGSTFKQWNKGVTLSIGEFIWIAESDDYSDLEFLQESLKKGEQNKDLSLIYCNSSIVNSQGTLIDNYINWVKELDNQKWLSDYENSGKDEVGSFFIYRNIIPNVSSVLFRRSFYMEENGAPEDMVLCGDWFLYLKLLTKGDISYVSKTLNYYRVHNETVRSKYFFTLQGFSEVARIFHYAFFKFNLKNEDIYKSKFIGISSLWINSLLNSGWNLKMIIKYFKYYSFIKKYDNDINIRFLHNVFKRFKTYIHNMKLFIF